MDGQVDSHQWVSKMETQCHFSGKPDLKIDSHTQTDTDVSTFRAKSLPGRMSSFFRRAVAERTRT